MGGYHSAEMQSVYSTAPTDWATYEVENTNCINKGRDLRLANKLQIVPRET